MRYFDERRSPLQMRYAMRPVVRRDCTKDMAKNAEVQGVGFWSNRLHVACP